MFTVIIQEKYWKWHLEIGSLENIKIENMRLQHTSLLEKSEQPKELKGYGFVAVAVGDGLKKAFEDLG